MNINNHIHHASETEILFTAWTVPQLFLALPFIFALIMYIIAAFLSSRRYKPWPLYRTIFWTFGVLFAVIAVVGPIANLAHRNFIAHMLGHLLLGMLAPLLMVLAAPMTLALRTLNIPLARRLSRILRSRLSRIITHPIVASFLNLGGLWILYNTDLYLLMHENTLIHIIVHFHVFIAGYLFTVSMVYIDPIAHRISFLYRSIVLIVFLAGHGVLAKFIYAHPPTGVPLAQAEIGGMLMYYGGDIIDIIIIYILFLHWFRATRPRIELTLR